MRLCPSWHMSPGQAPLWHITERQRCTNHSQAEYWATGQFMSWRWMMSRSRSNRSEQSKADNCERENSFVGQVHILQAIGETQVTKSTWSERVGSQERRPCRNRPVTHPRLGLFARQSLSYGENDRILILSTVTNMSYDIIHRPLYSTKCNLIYCYRPYY